MKQLGNLALICARRSDVTFVMIHGTVTVVVFRPGCKTVRITAEWDDDKRIGEIIHELNFGKYAEKAA